ncbi:DNRLRE domain-containing protein [Kinneretia aquatilis]|uniref:DNRLRE domain-containing protein n=1 Tax=Kinneretia aquatilis TaxID=2070761 RepID=UPI001CBD35F7|nr:DNRLRE domain-containing protein [Paucibacter aquatile]WIV98209.1 DNRLRE domain-containing protein [Paucibacter aquatile]
MKTTLALTTALLLAPWGQTLAADAPVTLKFQQGVNGYTGTQDAHIRSNETSGGDSRGVNYGSLDHLSIDGDDGSPGAKPNQGLIRFEQLFGTAAGQIRGGDTIVSATLQLQVFDAGSGFTVHQMLRDWNQSTVSWNLVGAGIQTHGVEASTNSLASVGANNSNANIGTGLLSIDVTASLQAMQAGTVANHGWLLQPFAAGSNGIDFHSSEASNASLRPLLSVQLVSSVPEPQSWALLGAGLLAILGLQGRRSRRH